MVSQSYQSFPICTANFIPNLYMVTLTSPLKLMLVSQPATICQQEIDVAVESKLW